VIRRKRRTAEYADVRSYQKQTFSDLVGDDGFIPKGGPPQGMLRLMNEWRVSGSRCQPLHV
jgi:hypothetical protein